MSAEVEVRKELDAARRRVQDLEQALALITGEQPADNQTIRRKRRVVLPEAERERRILAVLGSIPLRTAEVVERANAGTLNPVSTTLHKLADRGAVLEVTGDKRNNLLWRLPAVKVQIDQKATATEAEKPQEPKPKRSNGKSRKRRPPGEMETERLAKYIRESGPATTDEVVQTFKISPKYATTVLGRLREQGVLTTAEPMRRGHLTTWMAKDQNAHPGQMVLRPGEGLFRRGERRQ